MRCANQIVDMLCKDVAEIVRRSSAERRYLKNREEELKELLVWLGRLTMPPMSVSCLLVPKVVTPRL